MLSQVEIFILGWNAAQNRILSNVHHRVTDVLSEEGMLEVPPREHIVDIIKKNTPEPKNEPLTERWCIG